MRYELTTITCPPLELEAVSAAVQDWAARCGPLLGAWRTEHGELFQLKVLRGFANSEALEQARERALLSGLPFGIESAAVTMSTEGYAPFPFLPAVQPATFGRFYEFRTYFLRPGGLAPTLAGWQAAIGPARDYTRHLVINMYAIDGPPRMTHIWGFASLEERIALRARHYADGSWPPRGGPQQILRATSTIAIPEVYSPLT